MDEVFARAPRHLRDPRERPLEAARAWVRELEDDPAPDMYGTGALLESFEAEVAELLGKPAALFLPSGILAQQIALRIHAERSGRVAIGYHPRAHLVANEESPLEVVHGLRTVHLGQRTRLLTLEDLHGCRDRLAALLLELPQRELGGELPTWDELCAQFDWARSRGTALHLDGARLWEATTTLGKTCSEVCAPFDSVYVSFYKGLDGVAGAALAGEEDLIHEARAWQRRLGGNLIHLWPLVVSARRGLRERLPKMASYVARAKEVAAIFAAQAGVVVRPSPPQTPMFHAFLPAPPAAVDRAARKMAEEDGLVLFTRASAADVPGLSLVEITCGERALVLDDEAIRSGLERLMALAAAKVEA